MPKKRQNSRAPCGCLAEKHPGSQGVNSRGRFTEQYFNTFIPLSQKQFPVYPHKRQKSVIFRLLT